MPGPTLPIWPASYTSSDDPRDVPTLTLYPAADAAPDAGTVIVCPGGGYANLANHEGEPVALWLNSIGLHAAVLRYRLAPRHKHPAMVQDGQRAVRLVRHHAEEWGVGGGRVGILGFSAGGHLASSVAVHYENFHCAADDLAGVEPARPDAAVLCYPVIEMVGSFVHIGSRDHLLGRDLPEDLLNLMTTYRQVTPKTPPTFLWHTADDPGVPVENSIRFAEACRQQKVPFELHIYETGRHGLGLADGDAISGTWTRDCARFLLRHLAPTT